MSRIEAAEKMVEVINNGNGFAKARVWTSENYEVIRVYLEKGFIIIKDNDKANIENVGRNLFDVAKLALSSTGYTRVYS